MMAPPPQALKPLNRSSKPFATQRHSSNSNTVVLRSLGKRLELILEIQFSIDGVDSDHNGILGQCQFDKLMETYNRLKPIQERN